LYDQGYACVIQVLNYHYVAVKNVSGSTVEIMDPGYSNRPTIASYANPLRIYYYKVSGNPSPQFKCHLDFPQEGGSYVDSVYIQGWAVVPSGCTHVTAWCNGQVFDVPLYDRGDVPDGKGFATYIPVEYLKNGSNTLDIFAYHDTETWNVCSIKINYTDSEGPTISNAKITDLTSTGYTITCEVTDNAKVASVQFPTWTHNNGQDDLIWHEGTISGNQVSCRINVSDHNGEVNCVYQTDIYAYDTAGNCTSYINQFLPYVDATAPTISDVEIVDVSENGYTVKCTATDNHAIDRVQFPTWFEADNPFNGDGSWKTSSAYKGKLENGKYVFRVNTSDYKKQVGTYHTDIYAFDECGNYTKYSTDTLIKRTPITAKLTMSPSGSAVKGSQVKLNASASGGSGNFTYKFWISDENNENWYLLRDYGKSSTYTWTTGAVGKKHLYVDVKDSYGTVKRVGITFEVKNKAVTASLSASPSGSAVSGSQVKLTAGAGGGSGNYTYKFLICDAKGNWYKLRDYAKSNTYTWTTGTVGKKTLYVDVKDSNGTVKRAGITFEVKNKALTASLSASPSGSTVSGSQVKLTAGASGGSGNYTYKFLVCDAKGNWYKLRDYGKSNTYIWTTGAAGKKTLYVDVKDNNGTVKRAALSYEVKSKTALSVTLSASPLGSTASGSNVVLIAKATGGSGKYTYKFLICDAKGNWYKLQDYSTDNACVWKTGATGKKTLYVDVKDSTGQYVRKPVTFTVTAKK
ncbi:GBS Bsp-like repeat-containing protein, partial [Blautia sp. MSJ-19]|uniref:GBS Bsp-like repeat-containing protein n=1 Tax=Blautia sp. MSJ-19 TaxID=2841517 RepID=UPI001C0EAB46